MDNQSHAHFLHKEHEDCDNICVVISVLEPAIDYVWGTLWYSWLRHLATSCKVAGSISDGVIGIFH
jgi:hypothetical protein